MVTKRIHIENLRITLPKGMRNDASSAARTIANDVAESVANAATGQASSMRVGEISIGRVQDISAVGSKAANKVNEILNKGSRK